MATVILLAGCGGSRTLDARTVVRAFGRHQVALCCPRPPDTFTLSGTSSQPTASPPNLFRTGGKHGEQAVLGTSDLGVVVRVYDNSRDARRSVRFRAPSTAILAPDGQRVGRVFVVRNIVVTATRELRQVASAVADLR